MLQQFTFKPYVPKSVLEAKQRAVETNKPERTNTSGKTSTPGDSVDVPNRAVIQDEINTPCLGVDVLARSGSVGEETVALGRPSAVLSKELQLREVVQEDSVSRAQTEDFEDWLRGDQPSPEQPGNKRVQQPTPEYDDSDTEDARRKRPRLAGEVGQSTLVDSATTAGSHEKEEVAKGDTERQTTVQELASPINFGQLSKDRCTSPTPRTRRNNDAGQAQGDIRFIERPAYPCTEQTRSLISALYRSTAPLPRNGLNTETPTCCTISGHQTAVQKSALVERPVATQTQRLSWDQRVADLANRAASMDQQAADLTKRAASLTQRAAELDQRAAELDQRAADLDQRAASMDQRAASMDQRAASMDQRVAEMDQRALDMDGPAAEVWQRPADLDQRSADLEERGEDLEERGEDHDHHVTNPHQQARAPSRQPSRASNQTVAGQRCDIYADGHFDEDDDFASEDGASVCGNEEDADHRLEAAHFSRGRLSQKQKHDLIDWRNKGKPVDWIAKQLNRRKENIAKLEEDARKSFE